MSLFVTYDAEAYEYLLQPAGYGVLILLMLASLLLPSFISSRKNQALSAKQLSFCAIAIALAMVTSFIKFAALPLGGSITFFSMFFICFIGYLYGPKIGIMTGIAYGILQLLVDPYIFAPIQLLLDYPRAFGALGLAGVFRSRKCGLFIGCLVGMLGRYFFHVLSGYVFFAAYAPEGMNPLLYTLGYNMTYILPEMLATLILISLPAMAKALEQIRRMALEA